MRFTQLLKCRRRKIWGRDFNLQPLSQVPLFLSRSLSPIQPLAVKFPRCSLTLGRRRRARRAGAGKKLMKYYVIIIIITTSQFTVRARSFFQPPPPLFAAVPKTRKKAPITFLRPRVQLI
jgi:hypothetical protein